RARTMLQAAHAAAHEFGMKTLEERTRDLADQHGVALGADAAPLAAPAPIARDLRLLAMELGRGCAERLELDELIPFATGKCREALDAESAAVLLIDRQRDEFYFPHAADDDAAVVTRLQSLRFPSDKGIAGAAAHSGRGVR